MVVGEFEVGDVDELIEDVLDAVSEDEEGVDSSWYWYDLGEGGASGFSNPNRSKKSSLLR